jgi:hypothetical protein
MDLKLYPETFGVLTYSTSLARTRFFSAPYNDADLDLDMFNLKDANGLLYAALETTSGVYAGSRDIPPEIPQLPESSVQAADTTVGQAGELPEPGTLVLICVALGALGVASKPRKRSAR